MLYQRIQEAERRLRAHVVETPLSPCAELSRLGGAEVFLKCEHLQHTGSFKYRGALNKILCLGDAARGKAARGGVIAASSGNHGMAVARAARIAECRAVIHVPADVSDMKRRAIEGLGAEVRVTEGDALAAEITARAAAERHGRPYLSPYNDLDVIAGQGTIGVELARQQPGLDAVFASVGGGGLIAGIASHLSRALPGAEIVGCWPENAPTLHECLVAGDIHAVAERPTISDGTAGGVEAGSLTFEPCRALIGAHVLVSEDEIRRAMRLIAEQERWMIEGAAGVAVAGFLKLAEGFAGKRVAIILCGRNIGLDKFVAAMA